MIDASILVVTYNHAPYIKHCFSSILAQETNKKIEIVWYDDCSTDNTIENGEEILKNCNHSIVRLHSLNNRKQRRIPFRLDMIERCTGEYVFITDGDDFWIDRKKIETQISALNNHPSVNICFTPAFIFKGNEINATGVLGAHGDKLKIFSLEQVIEGDGGFMPTNSICLRRSVYDMAPDWFYGYLPVGDYPIQVIASNPNGALYIPTVTCGYRHNLSGSWTNTVFNVKDNKINFEIEFIEMLKKLYEYIPNQKSSFEKIARSHTASFFQLCMETNDYSKLSNLHTVLNSLHGK